MKAFIALFMLAAIATTGCKKDKAVDCVAAAKKYQKAGEVFWDDQTKENCKAYKEALNEYVNSSCFSSLPQAQKDMIKASVDDIDCD